MHLPPLHDLNEIFADIAKHAMELGFDKVASHLTGRALRVVTMCSGTESPILALEMIRDSELAWWSTMLIISLCSDISIDLKSLFGVDFNFAHLFSAEIEPFKQAYIERNFHPPHIFRDVNDLKYPVA